MIFGTQNAKFISGVTTVDIPFSIIDPDFIVPQYIVNQSAISGKRNFLKTGYYSEFVVQVNLFKYDDPGVSYNDFETYRGQSVTFHPHKDGDPIQDIFGQDVQFLISDIEGFYLDNTYEKDLMNIHFKADRYSSLISVASLGYGFGYGIDYGNQL